METIAQKGLPRTHKRPARPPTHLTLVEKLSRAKRATTKIKEAQQWTGTFLPRALLVRLIRRSIQEQKMQADRVTDMFVTKLGEVLEAKIIALLSAAVSIIADEKISTLKAKHIRLVLQIIQYCVVAKKF